MRYDTHDILHFTGGRLLPVSNWPAVSLHWSATLMVIWCFLGNSSNGQIAAEPAPVLTLQADPREYDPFTPEIAYSPAGKFIASWKRVSIGGGFFGFGGSSTTSHLKIWNVVTGKEVLSHSEPFIRISYSPHEDMVIIASYPGMTVYNLKDGQNIAKLPQSGHPGMWFSQDGDVLLSMSVLSREEQAPAPEVARESVNSAPVVHLKALSTTAWHETPHFVNQLGPLHFWASVSRNKKFIASFVENDGGDSTMKIWDLSSGEGLPSPDIEYPDGLFDPEFVCDDDLLLIPDFSSPFPKGNRLWHIEKGQWLEQRSLVYPRPGFPAHLWPYSVSPSLTVEATDQFIIARDSTTDEIRTQFPRPKSWDPILMDPFNTFPFGKGSHLLNERTLVVAYPETTARGENFKTSSLDFVDLSEGTITTLVNHEFLAGSRTGKYFVTRDALKKIDVLWKESDKSNFANLPVSGSLQFSPNEETFATSHKGEVKLWSIQSFLSQASSGR